MSTLRPVTISCTSAALLLAARLLPPHAGAGRCSSSGRPLQTPLLPSLVSCSQSGRTGGRGAPLGGRSPPLLCASSLARSRAPQGAERCSGAPLLPACFLGACHSVPPAISSLSFLSLSPCPPGTARLLTHPPQLALSLSLSLKHTQSFDLDAPTVTHTDPLSRRLNTDDRVPHGLSASRCPRSPFRGQAASSSEPGLCHRSLRVSEGSGHPWPAGQCRLQDPEPGSASAALWLSQVKQGARRL